MAGEKIDRRVELPGRGSTSVREVRGPDGAPAVLLLHGLGATGRLNWGPCFGPLSEHFRVVGIDQRGHGGGIRTRRFRLEDCADDAAAVADVLGIERFVVVGYSMGGPIGSLVWRRHPDRVTGLVLCATARHFTSRTTAVLTRAVMPGVAQAARLLPRTAHRRIVERMLARIEHPQLRERVLEELAGNDPAALFQAAGEIGRFSSRDWIGGVDVPTAVIVTARDRLVTPARQRDLAASIPGAETYEVEGDHAACVSAVGVFVPTLVRACQRVVERANG
jgi:pimeloyl-ACP methyl ester carboxylesterase